MKDKKIITLINLIDNVIEEYDESFGEEYDVIDEFSDKLNDLFNINELDNELLEKISKIMNKEIFYYKFYMTDKFYNNEIRKIISNYIDKKYNLYFDYETIKQNIKDNYKLFGYLNEVEKNDILKIQELININPKVILLIDNKLLTKEFIIENMRKNNFISLIFLGEYKDSYLYKYSDYYDLEEVQELLYSQLKDIITSDIFKYVNASSLVKNNIKIAKKVLNINSKFIAYVGKKILNNKEIMIDMIEKDKSNVYYLTDDLKKDKDINNILNNNK